MSEIGKKFNAPLLIPIPLLRGSFLLPTEQEIGNHPSPQSFIPSRIMNIGYASGGSSSCSRNSLYSFCHRSPLSRAGLMMSVRHGEEEEPRHSRRTAHATHVSRWLVSVDRECQDSPCAHNSGQSAYVHTCERTYVKRTQTRVRNTDRDLEI